MVPLARAHCILGLGVQAIGALEEAKKGGAEKRCCSLTSSWSAPFLPDLERSREASPEMPAPVPRPRV